MKLTVTSFLFLFFTYLITNSLHAQSTDSTQYYVRLIKNPRQSNDLARAFKYFLKEKETSVKTKSLIQEIYANQNLAEIHKKLGHLYESEQFNIETLRLLELVENKTAWTDNCYLKTINELGILYREKKDYLTALSFYNEALKTATLPKNISTLLNNKGRTYESLQQLDNAKEFYEKAYKMAIEVNDSSKIARSLSNLSYVKSKLKIPGAEEGLIEALNLRLKGKSSNALGSSYSHLTKFYLSKKDTTNMTKYSDLFLHMAHKNGVARQLESALRLKIQIGDSNNAKEYLRLSDSLLTINKTQLNNFNYYMYQYDKKEKDLQESILVNERLIYLLLFIALGAVSIYFILKYKHRKEKLQEIYNTETRISRKIHDEVANDVYHVMTQLQGSPDANKTLLDNLEDIYKRTRDISRENSSIDLHMNFKDLISDLLLSYKTERINVISMGIQQMKWEHLNDLQKSTVYRVLQELLTNTNKHSQASIIVINFSHSGKSIVINYKDNGVGTELIKGNGLQNTVNRIHSINGSITFESEKEKGFKAIITI